jgi:hypothetical protein
MHPNSSLTNKAHLTRPLPIMHCIKHLPIIIHLRREPHNRINAVDPDYDSSSDSSVYASPYHHVPYPYSSPYSFRDSSL